MFTKEPFWEGRTRTGPRKKDWESKIPTRPREQIAVEIPQATTTNVLAITTSERSGERGMPEGLTHEGIIKAKEAGEQEFDYTVKGGNKQTIIRPSIFASNRLFIQQVGEEAHQISERLGGRLPEQNGRSVLDGMKEKSSNTATKDDNSYFYPAGATNATELLDFSSDGLKNKNDLEAFASSNVAKFLQKIIPESLEKNKQSDLKDKVLNLVVSHDGILESFLSKLIELTEGVERKGEFASSLGKEGFDYAEGFRLTAQANPKTPEEVNLFVSYKSKNGFYYGKMVRYEVLDEVIKLANS